MKHGEIEIGIRSDFTLPPCDPIVYAPNIQYALEGDYKEYDPITHEVEKKRAEERKEKRKKNIKSFKKGVSVVGKFIGSVAKDVVKMTLNGN